ncbi:TRP-domain-containing protein [Coniochaeta sp. PMI_546]|nr:TRP-domain-containing protein [Coniochaeta sp. PMI_546]
MAVQRGLCATFFLLLSVLALIATANARDTEYIYGTGADGKTRQLAVDRTPALYTKDFGDCLGGESLFNVTKFDAAYYTDNLTIIFHLDGTTNIKNESLMMHISVDAYGSSRFSMTFDPCELNIYSLCPLNASRPIEGWAVIPVGPQQVGDIPPIAFGIPDFEGSTKVQIFANSSRTEIGCFQAVMRNGNSFSHPEAVAPALGAFTLVAIIASFLSAAYGVSTTHMRTHFAHSLPVLLVFETFQTIFFSGALTVNWPSVLVAWWSNFAWSAGLIYVPGLVHSVDSFAGITGNASQVGGAGSTVINNGGGLAAQIYGRSVVGDFAGILAKRAAYNESNPYDYNWSGDPVTPGMPLPGTWTGFPGTLSGIDMPAPDAFLVSLIWTLVAVGLVMLAVTAFKFSLEGLARVKWIAEDRLSLFRSRWTQYLAGAVGRTFFIAFFAIMTLALYQFNVKAPAGALAVAAVVFVLFLVGMAGMVVYACRTRLRGGRMEVRRDGIHFRQAKLFDKVPFSVPVLRSTLEERGLEVPATSGLPWIQIRHLDDDPSRATVHQDEKYMARFGWLSARYRRTRWWYFAYYLGYQFFRACFVGAAVNSPLAQVYGLLIYEIVAFVIVAILNPFEGARNTALGVWMLGITKIVTTGLSIAFLPELGLDRIIATVIGVVIIVIQGFLAIGVLILIVLGAISTWMSLTRNREECGVEILEGTRVRYFEHLEAKAPDVWRPQPSKKGKEKEAADVSQEPKEPYFKVQEVRRAPKIEDEDGDVVGDMEPRPNSSLKLDAAAHPRSGSRQSRPGSGNSFYSVNSLPRGARAHRASWSSKDFAQWEASMERPDSSLAQRLSAGTPALDDGNNTTSTPLIATAANSRRNSLVSTPTGLGSSRPGSPLSPLHIATPSRERLRKHAEERRFLTSQVPSRGSLRGETTVEEE